MDNTYSSARIPAERASHLESSVMAKQLHNEYEYEDQLLTRRYGHHDYVLSSMTGYVNHSWEDVGERGRDGYGVRYNYDNHRGGLKILFRIMFYQHMHATPCLLSDFQVIAVAERHLTFLAIFLVSKK
jgi:hypothetical protein